MEKEAHEWYARDLIREYSNINYPQQYDETNQLYLSSDGDRISNNCYCYALGMVVENYARKLFMPGWISDYSFYESSPKMNRCRYPRYNSKEEFVEKILKDIEFLKIPYEIILDNLDASKLGELLHCCKNEQSSIIVAGAGNLENGYFHFVRSDVEGFSHKEGWHMLPKQISNVEDAFQQYKCNPVLALRLKNRTK